MADGLEIVAQKNTVHTLKSVRQVVLHALTLQDFVAVRQQALHEYKRARISTWTQNADLLPEDMRQQAVLDAMRDAQSIDYGDLPTKQMSTPILRNGKLVYDVHGNPERSIAEVEYAIWWMSDTAEGKLHSAWLSMRKDPSQASITKDEADSIFMESFGDLDEAAEVVADMSQDKAGNSSSPDNGAPRTRTGKRRKSHPQRKPGHISSA